jgi:hypothetical protein
MIGLTILGAIIAFAWYYAVDIALQQAALHPPANIVI